MASDGLSDVVLIGGSQCGKSTLFNSLVGGRELSPCGVGLKTSACIITAIPVVPEEPERVEIVWRSSEELESLAKYVPSDGLFDELDLENLRRIIKLINRFSHSGELEVIKTQSCFDFLSVQRVLTYPKNWDVRWHEVGHEGFTLEDVLFVFIKRVIYHVHSEVLLELKCTLTDSPGFDSGIWDEVLSRESMLSADLLVCVLEGSKSVVGETYLNLLSCVKKYNLCEQLIFALNAFVEKDIAKRWAEVNFAKLNQNGYLANSASICVFNAALAYFAVKNDECNNAPRNTDVNNIATYLNLNPVGDNAKIRELISSPREICRKSGLEELISFLGKSINERRREVGFYIKKLSLGKYQPASGYDWVDDSNFVTRLVSGVKIAPIEQKPKMTTMIQDGETLGCSEERVVDNTRNTRAIANNGDCKGVIFGIERFPEKLAYVAAATAVTALASIWNPGVACAAAAMAAREYKSKFG